MYSARFYYDKLGRIVVSQNSRQKGQDKYSYTLYDGLGRVIEAGEKSENASGAQFAGIFGTDVGGQYVVSVIDDAKLNTWITTTATTTLKEVTHSYYDKTNTNIAGNGFGSYHTLNKLTQRKRITHVTYEAVYDASEATYDHATHYDYDIHGNVVTLVQDNKLLGALTSLSGQRFKKLEYIFDLISGNVHRVDYQTGKADQWHHAYEYDADNRITDVYTTTATPMFEAKHGMTQVRAEATTTPYWEREAAYSYYDHGPLAKTTIGEHEVQGLDYIYTLQGWIKSVNSNTLSAVRDPGLDGYNIANSQVAQDVMGYSLHYYTGDYSPIGGNSSFIGTQTGSDLVDVSYSKDMFNGNIARMVTTITDPDTRSVMPLGSAYQYDQLNRLLTSRSFTDLHGGSNTWASGGTVRYRNDFTYDANGNIKTQRREDASGVLIDSLRYFYDKTSNETMRNRLYHVEDYVGSGTYTDDIDDMGTFVSGTNINTSNNYAYDAEGRLIKDNQEQIASIEWTFDGKVKKINRMSGSNKKNVSFDYDALGHRVAKHVLTSANLLEKSIYYISDATGSVMSTYVREIISSTVYYSQKEKYIIASSFGIFNDSISLYGSQNSTYTQTTWTHAIGKRNYSLSEHRGNTLTVISDKLILHGASGATSPGTVVDYFMADIIQTSDYTPFGVTIQERNLKKTVSGVRDYAMGFQGQLEDDEIKGEGNSLNYEYRMHDPRLGRFFAIDPLSVKYPYFSSYQFSGNRVIDSRELEGLEPDNVNTSDSKNIGNWYLAKSNAAGQENQIYYYQLQENWTGSGSWYQGPMYPGPTTEASALMAEDIYKYKNYPVGSTFFNDEEQKEKTVSGYSLTQVTVDEDGFTSGLYRRTVEGIEFYALVFAGTDQGVDWVNNIEQGAGISASQYERAAEYGKYFKDCENNLTIIGHSLGGGLASLAGLISGRRTITFNAAGLSPQTKLDYGIALTPQTNINAYIIKGEILNKMLWSVAQQAEGIQHWVDSKLPYYTFDEWMNICSYKGDSQLCPAKYEQYINDWPTTNHSMDQVIKALGYR